MSGEIGQSESKKEVVAPPVRDVRRIVERLGTCTLQEAVQFVDQFGIDPRGCEPPAFLLAASNPDPAVVALFLERGINSQNAPVYGRSCAYEYARNNRRALAILATHQIPLPTYDLVSFLPCLIAHDEVAALAVLFSKMDHYLKERALEILLCRDDHNGQDDRDYVIRVILDSGFDINMTQEKAMLQLPNDSALVFYQSNYYLPPLFRLSRRPDLLIGRNTDFNIRDPHGNTICHVLASGCRLGSLGVPLNRTLNALVLALDCGADPCAVNHGGFTVLQVTGEPMVFDKQAILFLAGCDIPPSVREYSAGRTRIWANLIVRRTGIDICLALQALELPALITCEILQARYSAWPRIPFHCYWNIAVAVKHFLAPAVQKNKKRCV